MLEQWFRPLPPPSLLAQPAPGDPARARKRTHSPTDEGQPVPKCRKNWSVEEVVAWLGTLSLPHLADRFRENGVDGELLSATSKEELISELGLTPLQAKKVLMQWGPRST